jgi:beta-lactamase class A
MRYLIRSFFVLEVLLAPLAKGYTQTRNLAQSGPRIQAMADAAAAKVGVAVMGLNFSDSLTVNGRARFPMQSVYKFPLAITTLSQVDARRLSLGQKIPIRRKSLDTATWSPMLRELLPDTVLTLADVLRYAVSKSDNNACDILFHLVGGTAVVDTHMHSIGIANISVKATEAQMKTAWPIQYTNWCQPAAMLKLLHSFYKGRLLSKSSNAFLMKIMTETETGPRRIKGGLPPGTTVAHKTGTSDTNEDGLTAATNDVGIVTLPDGRHYALAVFVSDYHGGVSKGEQMIAEISRIVWDYFQAH